MVCDMLIASCPPVSTELADLDNCLQMGAIDLQAMAMALGCCWVPPIKKMNRHKPTPHTCTLKGLLLMISAAIGLQLTHIALMLFMRTRPGFLAGTGTAHLVSCPLQEKKRIEKTTPFGVNLMRSQVLYQAAQVAQFTSSIGMFLHPASSFGNNLWFLLYFLQSVYDDTCQWHLHGLSLHHTFS